MAPSPSSSPSKTTRWTCSCRAAVSTGESERQFPRRHRHPVRRRAHHRLRLELLGRLRHTCSCWRRMVAPRKLGQATAADVESLDRTDVIAGVVHQKAAPSANHGDAQGALTTILRARFLRKGGGSNPGGWWLLTEVAIELETHEVYVPDISGWRRECVPERPSGHPWKNSTWPTRSITGCAVASPGAAE